MLGTSHINSAPMSYKINRFLFYLSAVVSSVAFTLLGVKVYHFDVPLGDRENVGLMFTLLSSFLLSLAQSAEWRRKANL
jgi:hypothetical protein